MEKTFLSLNKQLDKLEYILDFLPKSDKCKKNIMPEMPKIYSPKFKLRTYLSFESEMDIQMENI